MRVYHDFRWTMLVHFTTNFSYEEGNTIGGNNPEKIWMSPASPKLRFDYKVYREYLEDSYTCRLQKNCKRLSCVGSLYFAQK